MAPKETQPKTAASRRCSVAEKLEGMWQVTERYFCYGNENYPDEDYMVNYETPVWEFKDGKATFKDLAFEEEITYRFTVENDRLILHPDGCDAPDEFYRISIRGNKAALYELEEVDAAGKSVFAEVSRLEIERYRPEES